MPEKAPATTISGEEDLRSSVLGMLKAAQLAPSREEVDALVAAYPALRRMTDALYQVPGRYELPALHFEPTPVFADWAS